MAQVVKLKRSSVAGKAPTTGSLELGELAINTHDGKVFLKKSSSAGFEIEHLVTTNSQTSGSLELTGNITSSGTVSASFFIGDGSQLTNLDLGSITSVTNADTASISDTSSFIAFNGNRNISNQDLVDIVNQNFGGTNLKDFIENVFFPNDPPVIEDYSGTIKEFETNLNTLTPSGELVASDPEGQSITFRTASTYTDGKFNVSSTGVISLIASKTSGSFNTGGPDADGLDAHEIEVEAVDSFGVVGTKTIFIRVIENSPPKFFGDQVGGTEISSITLLRSESADENANITEFFVSDTDGDSIEETIATDPTTGTSHFNIERNGNTFTISQTAQASNLNINTQQFYYFSVTASDSHYNQGDDVDSITKLPITIELVDNAGPSIFDQVFSVNENSDPGTNLGQVIATDPDGDSIDFTNFTLKSAHANINGTGANITESLGGTGLNDPTANPFYLNANTLFRRTGTTFLNDEIAASYIYTVNASDASNANSPASAEIKIQIESDTSPIITDNNNGDNPFIIESAVANNLVTKNTDGINSGNAFRANFSEACDITINSTNDLITPRDGTNNITTTRFKLASNLSGSGLIFDNSDTITLGITASKSDFTTSTTTREYQIQITKNNSPTITPSLVNGNLNTNDARNGAELVQLNFSDIEGDAINNDSFSCSFDSTNPTLLSSSRDAGNVYGSIKVGIGVNADSGTYGYTASIEDVHGFRTTFYEDTFNISTPSPIGIDSGSNLFISKGARNTEGILSSEALAKTGSNFDQSTNYANIFTTDVVSGGLPITYALGAGRDSSKFNLSVTDSTASIILSEHLSGSSFEADNELHFSISSSDNFGNISPTKALTASLVDVTIPTIEIISITENYNTNEARSNASSLGDTNSPTAFKRIYFVSGTFGIVKSDQIVSSSLLIDGFITTGSSFGDITSGDDVTSHARKLSSNFDSSSPPTAGTYKFEVTASDNRGFSSNTSEDVIIEQAGSGSLTDPGGIFIIDSAQTADAVVNTSAGTASADNSNLVQLAATYDSDEGNPETIDTGWFTASSGHDNRIDISPSGFLSASAAFSSNPPTSDLSCKVHFEDTYGNIGTGSFTINIVPNQGPIITPDRNTLSGLYNTNQATNGTVLITATITDPEGDTPFDVLLSGSDASSFEISSFDNTDSSSFSIAATTDLSVARTYDLHISASDSVGTQALKDSSITISTAASPILAASDVVICQGARATEIFTTNNSDAKNSTIAQRTVNSTDQTDTARIVINNGSQIPGFTSIQYAVHDGRDSAYIHVENFSTLGRLSVAPGQHVSGNFDPGDELHFRIKGTDNLGGVGFIAVTSSVVAPNFNEISFSQEEGTILALGNNGNDPRGTNSQISGSLISKAEITVANENNNSTYPLTTPLSDTPNTSDFIEITNFSKAGGMDIIWDISKLEYNSTISNNSTKLFLEINTNTDLPGNGSPGNNFLRFRGRRIDNRGFTSSTVGSVQSIYIVPSPSPTVDSGSNFFISEGAQANEFILSTETAALTGSRFSTTDDSGYVHTNYSETVNNIKHGTVTPINFQILSGRDSAYIETGSNLTFSSSLQLKINLSGSSAQTQDELHFKIKAIDQFGNSGSNAVTASIVDVTPPSASFTLENVLNTNDATAGTNILTTSIKEGTFTVDKVDPFNHSFSGNGFSQIDNPTEFLSDGDVFSDTTAVSSDFNTGDYQLTASIVDDRGFNQESTLDFTIENTNTLSLPTTNPIAYVNKGARTDERYKNSENSAKADPLSGNNTSTITATYNETFGDPRPITYTLVDGTGLPYVSMSYSSNVAYLYVGGTHISGNLDADDEIHFRLGAKDNFSNEITSSFTASVTDFISPQLSFNSSIVSYVGRDTNQFNNGELFKLFVFESSEGSYPLYTGSNSVSMSIYGANDFPEGTLVSASEWVGESVKNLFFSGSGTIAANESPGYSKKLSVKNNRFSFAEQNASRSTKNIIGINIIQAPSGTLDTVNNANLFEFASVDDPVVTNSHGRSSGTPIRLSVTYDTSGDTGNFGNPQVDSGSRQGFFTASSGHDSKIFVTKDGYVSASSDYTSGTTDLNCKVHFEDQYGNIGTGSFTVNRVANIAPDVSVSLRPLQHPITDGNVAATFNISDGGGDVSFDDSPYSASLLGNSANLLKLNPTLSDSSSYQVIFDGDLDSSVSNINYTIKAFDQYEVDFDQVSPTQNIDAQDAEWRAYFCEDIPSFFATTLIDSSYTGNITPSTAENGSFIACIQAGSGSLDNFTSSDNKKATLIASGTILQGSNNANEAFMDRINPLSGSTASNVGMMLVIPKSTTEFNFIQPVGVSIIPNGTEPAGTFVVYIDRLNENDSNASIILRNYTMDAGKDYFGRSEFYTILSAGNNITDESYYVFESSASGENDPNNFRIG